MADTMPCPTPGCPGVRPRRGAGHCTPCRFWRKVDKAGPNGCWTWTAACNENGYGQFNLSTAEPIRAGARTSRVMAYRYAYELLIGPIPGKMQIDHLCRNRGCVNPEHLEPVTARVNVLRGDTFVAAQAAQTHCLRGHEFTPENTWTARGTRKRNCRTCHRERARIYREAKRVAQDA